MAVPSGAFSIREYVASMRTVDVAKSHPFDGAPALAPMEVKKFRYWSDELEKLKPRGKGPKKRSIADIFAVAPHVEREDAGADYLDDEGGESDGDDPRVLALCDAKIKEKILAKKSKLSVSKKKELNRVDRKEKKPSNTISTKIPKNSLRKGSEENASIVVPMLKKKRSKLKSLAPQSQQKSVETSKSTKQTKSDKGPIICSQQLSILVENDQQNKSSNTSDSMGPKGNTSPQIQNSKAPIVCVNDHLVERGKNIAANEYESEVFHPKILNLMANSEDFPSHASSSRFIHFRNEDENRDSSNADVSRATTTSSIEFRDTIPRPSFPFSSSNGKEVNYDYSVQQHQSLSYISPGETFRSTVPFSEHGFCGLPLNSQGEWIHFSSNESGKGMFNPSMLDISQSRDNVYGGSKEIELFKSPRIQNFLELPSSSRAYNLENRKRTGPVSQQTMRLMGKEFMIGKSNDESQSSDDGNIWTDKQIIAEHHAASSSGIDTSSSKTLPYEQGLNLYYGSGKSAENIFFDSQNQIHPLMSSNHLSQLHPHLLSAPSKPINVENFHLQEPFVNRYGYDSTRVNMNPSRPSFEFPFLNPVQDNVNSSTNLPSWQLSRNQHKQTPVTSYTSYFDMRDSFQPVSSLSIRQGSSFVPSRPLTQPNSRFMPTSVMNNHHGYKVIPKVSMNNFDKGKVSRKRRADKLNLTREKISNIDGFKPSSSVTQSKVPLTATTNSGLNSNLQRKLTPIFRF